MYKQMQYYHAILTIHILQRQRIITTLNVITIIPRVCFAKTYGIKLFVILRDNSQSYKK